MAKNETEGCPMMFYSCQELHPGEPKYWCEKCRADLMERMLNQAAQRRD